MTAYDSKFHDGFVDGFFIREPQVIIFIKTDGNEEFALIADDVTRMRVDGFLQGNIIFDIVIRQGEDLTRRDVAEIISRSCSATAARMWTIGRFAWGVSTATKSTRLSSARK